LALIGILLIVVFRAFIFVFWERAHFDADQAITGLMAKHLAELRAFPVFYYGQSYMLAVEAWLAAPLFAIAGASVATLKLPLLAINMAIAWLLLRGFVWKVGLRPALAAVPVLFFALPAAGTSARLVEANGGNVEPFLYVLLIWVLRDRPAWCGFVLGLGFLQREFTLYGFIALLLVEAVQRRLFTREGIRRRLVTLRTAAEVWLVVQWIKQYSSGAGPGTTLADVFRPHDNITELASRVCMDPGTIVPGFAKVATVHWPVLFGTAVHPLNDFGVAGSAVQGGWWAAVALVLVALVAIAGLARTALTRQPAAGSAAFCGFLVATAALSVTGYVVARCGTIDFFYTRYELLSILGLAGIAAWFLQREPSPLIRRIWLGLAAAWFIVTAVPHVRLHVEYLSHPPQDVRRLIINHLDARDARLAVSDYWIAYTLTFLTQERIIVASSDFVRIQEYQRRLEAEPGGAVRISREACEPGYQIVPRLYLCEP
jgi:hypothetical protein